MAKIKPLHDFDFQIPVPGWHVLRVDKADVVDIKEEDQKESKSGIKNTKNFVITTVVEGGDSDGIIHNEFCPIESKGDFGLRKLYGIMVDAEVMKEGELETEDMKSDKFQTFFKTKMPKVIFVGKFRHVAGTKDKDQTFARMIKTMSLKEFQKNPPQEKEKVATGTGTGKEEKTKEPEKKDPWESES